MFLLCIFTLLAQMVISLFPAGGMNTELQESGENQQRDDKKVYAGDQCTDQEGDKMIFFDSREHERQQLSAEKDDEIRILKEEKGKLLKLIEELRVQVDDSYVMKKKPHGIAVIINVFSVKGYGKRAGSKIDEENFRAILEFLKYAVKVLSNPTATEIHDQVSKIAEEDHMNHDSFILCGLSHGANDVLLGSDGEAVRISEITRLFDRKSCPSLEGKPKIFFIQTCREIVKDLPCSSMPNEPDYLIAYSTSAGYSSLRSPQHGSVYVNALCKVFRNNAHNHDLLSMLTMVSREVCEISGNMQCPAPVTLLRKKVFF